MRNGDGSEGSCGMGIGGAYFWRKGADCCRLVVCDKKEWGCGDGRTSAVDDMPGLWLC